MNLESDIRPISYIKTNAAEMLRQVNETQKPIVITQNGEAKAVLLDTKTYQDLVNAIGILKLLSQSEKEIEEGKVIEHTEAIRSARKHLTENNSEK